MATIAELAKAIRAAASEEDAAKLLQTYSDSQTDQIESTRNEAAARRTQRNQALRQSHALGQVLKAHNITFDINDADLSSLQIEDGKVKGEFDYTPKSLPATKVDPKSLKEEPSEDKSTVTLDSFKSMNIVDRMNNLDKVAPFLESA